MILLDTDHLSILVNRQAAAHATLMARLDSTADSLAVPMVCLEE